VDVIMDSSLLHLADKYANTT